MGNKVCLPSHQAIWSTLVQTTLLTFGIAIILALVAALVGPVMVDWQEHKAEIEAQAKEIVGAKVEVAGAIEVRLLPTPSLTLGNVQIGPRDSVRKVSARGLSMELSLGSLMRGEFRANQVTLDHPEVRIGLDNSGALQMPGGALNFGAERLAIERLTVTDGGRAECQRRGRLAHRSVQGRRRVHHARRALFLPCFRQSPRR
jgi:uncharacterized protein YhdP